MQYNMVGLANKRGISLVISTTVLMVVLLLTLHLMKSTQYNRKTISSFKSRLEAESGASAAINEAEEYIQNNQLNTSQFNANCTSGLCLEQDVTSILSNTTILSNAIPIKSGLQTITNLSTTPSYLIEYLGNKTPQSSISLSSASYGDNPDNLTLPVYRVTGISTGESGAKQTVIQTILY